MCSAEPEAPRDSRDRNGAARYIWVEKQLEGNGRNSQRAAPAKPASAGSYASMLRRVAPSGRGVEGTAVRSAADGCPIRSPEAERPSSRITLDPEERARFHALYCEHFDYVFRNLRRLGVEPASVDDALQDVYLVVLRRLGDLEHDTHTKAWLFAILLRIAGNHRRAVRRRATPESLGEHESGQPGPFDLTARAQAGRILHEFLSELEDAPRAVFVMAELEQMTAPEIARALSANLNTVYSWLRSARLQFGRTLRRLHVAGGGVNG
jgi:RNA polymerase sigma-70 factor (ECF subfamily)